MDKIKINNQIVQMRKFVKQAKVHVLNKLVKEAKLLQNRKGNENQVLKAKRKAERLLTKIAVIKKMKPDSISKLALSKALDWNSILQQKNSSLEDQCISMLANYKPVQEEVESFHANNKELISKIPEFLKEWEEKAKQQSEGSPKQIIKASHLRQKKKENKFKMKQNPRMLSNNRKLSQAGDELSSERSNSDLLQTNSQCPNDIANFEENNRLSTTDFDGIANFDSMDENVKLFSEEQNNLPKTIECLESNYSLPKLQIPPDKSEVVHPDGSTSCNFHDKVANNFTSFEDNDSFSNDSADNTSIKHSSIQENKNKLYLKSIEERPMMDMNRYSNDFESSETKIDSDNDNAESVKHSPEKKKCMINVGETKQSIMNKSHSLKIVKQLNSEDLKDCDEIPVINSSDVEYSNTDQSSDEELEADEQDGDPFFESVSEVKTHNVQHFKNKSVDEKALFQQKSDKSRVSNNSNITESSEFKHDNSESFSRWSAKRKFSNMHQQDRIPKRASYQNQINSNMFSKDRKTSFSEIKYTDSRKDSRTNFQGKKYPDSRRERRASFQEKKFTDSRKDWRSSFPEKKYTDSNKDWKTSFQKKKDIDVTKNRQTSFEEGKYTNPNDKLKPKIRKEKLNESLPIHPSWEAKRKLKETKNIPFQGKRMVFDD